MTNTNMSPWPPVYSVGENSIKVFLENGAEVPLHRWAGIVHAGMTAVIQFGSAAVMDPYRRGQENYGMFPMRLWAPVYYPARLLIFAGRVDTCSDILDPPSDYKTVDVSLPTMSPQQTYKAVGLERYPLSKLPSPTRPSAPRVNSLPSICEQSTTAVDHNHTIFPRSITPSPSPQPWKLLLQRAKAREYGKPHERAKSENDYFSAWTTPVDTAADTSRWPISTWSAMGGDGFQRSSSPDSLQYSDTEMDIDMGGIIESDDESSTYEREEQKTKSDHRDWEILRPEILQPQFRLQPAEVSISSKRKRGSDLDGEESDIEEGCRRAVKRTDFAMANYHRRRLHGLIQAV